MMEEGKYMTNIIYSDGSIDPDWVYVKTEWSPSLRRVVELHRSGGWVRKNDNWYR